ncbi:putative gypsy-type retrotransposon [Panicum miliaceum]|uniref:Gypsy-type retrotransposon n=1 Tax=Panicum miliaceum TaxID=4540 RepID=A0A3L6SPX5_PANMI|nr:putative gypsy-type retrotransposon [Panicum miliaceum]
MAGEIPEVAAAATTPPAPELAWSLSTTTDAEIEALVAALYHLRAYPSKGTPDVVDRAGFSLRQGGKYPEAIFKDKNRKWVEEWFMVANSALGLPPRTGLPPILYTRWEEKPTEEEMVEVEVLLAEL